MESGQTLAEEVPPQRSVALLIGAMACWVLFFQGIRLVSPSLSSLPSSVAMFLSSLVLTGTAMAIVIGWSRLYLHRTVYLVIGLIGLAAIIPMAKPMAERTRTIDLLSGFPGEVLFLTVNQFYPAMVNHEAIVTARNAFYQPIGEVVEPCLPEENPHRIMVLGLCQLVLSAGLGLWIGFGIDALSHLIPIALVAGMADIWSVSSGATAVIIRSSQIHYFLLRFPLVGGPTPDMPFLIGLTDFLFFGIFFTAAFRFGLGAVRNLILLGLSFPITVALAIFFHVGLPVLPVMALLFVGGNYSRLQVRKDELVKVGLFLVLCGGVAFVISSWLHR